MDDLFVFSDNPVKMLKGIDKHFKLGSIEELKDSELCVYTGLDFKWMPAESSCQISQGRYLEDIKTGLTDKQKRRVFRTNDLKKSEAHEVKKELEKVQQAWVGVLGWACKTQPQLSVVFSEIARNNTTPSDSSVLSVKRASEYAKATHRPLELKGVKRPVIVWWVDASYNIYTCDGRLGWEVQVVDEHDLGQGLANIPRHNTVQWKTKRTDRKCASTTSAELLAMMEAIKQLPGYVRMCKALWGLQPRVVMVTDSQPLLGWLRTGRAAPDPHFQGSLDLILERVREYKVEVLWVETKLQRADRHTKFVLDRYVAVNSK